MTHLLTLGATLMVALTIWATSSRRLPREGSRAFRRRLRREQASIDRFLALELGLYLDTTKAIADVLRAANLPPEVAVVAQAGAPAIELLPSEPEPEPVDVGPPEPWHIPGSRKVLISGLPVAA